MSTPLSRQMDQMADAQEWRERAENLTAEVARLRADLIQARDTNSDLLVGMHRAERERDGERKYRLQNAEYAAELEGRLRALAEAGDRLERDLTGLLTTFGPHKNAWTQQVLRNARGSAKTALASWAAAKRKAGL